MKIPEYKEIVEPNDQTEAREHNLEALTALVGNPYPNKFDRSNISGEEDTISSLNEFAPVAEVVKEIGAIVAQLAERERPDPEVKGKLNEKLEALGAVRVAGRLATPPRVMGKAAFVHLSDGITRLQIYVRKQDAVAISNDTGEELKGESGFELFGHLDHGDFVGVEGHLFLTNTGELSIRVEKIQFLSKAMVPMPDKMHGIADPELRRRYRYVDLIGSSLQVEHEGLTTREVFERRSKIISSMRRYLEDDGYIEVETPMLTPKATGAAAEPFETYHNALSIPLFARIAPELYLKRLMVGGFEKVYELNRNFRNEGIDAIHNPEFTMLEFYCAYMDVGGMMDLCEEMLKKSVLEATGSLTIEYEGNEIDFESFERLPMRDAITRFVPDAEITDENMVDLFEQFVEEKLTQPTFIIDYPKSISPLSKASPENPAIAERFELFIGGVERANGFSELNDPKEQYDRFIDQMKERESGDAEAMILDEDYIRALSYGMPPAAGIGIGVDRIVMLLTNQHSIRDVILFPHMRPEKNTVAEDEEE
ncbi:MAG: lysine--tRNA ligase [Pyrinomonadaceae bacterium]|nr:lysine--tRNA ligase [Pyrinomonadaceae bacterium]